MLFSGIFALTLVFSVAGRHHYPRNVLRDMYMRKMHHRVPEYRKDSTYHKRFVTVGGGHVAIGGDDHNNQQFTCPDKHALRCFKGCDDTAFNSLFFVKTINEKCTMCSCELTRSGMKYTACRTPVCYCEKPEVTPTTCCQCEKPTLPPIYTAMPFTFPPVPPTGPQRQTGKPSSKCLPHQPVWLCKNQRMGDEMADDEEDDEEEGDDNEYEIMK